MSKLFGTSGVRGSVTELFTDQFCFDIGRTFCQFLNKHGQTGPIALGLDPRSSSPMISKNVLKGIIFEGAEVVFEGAVPVPSMNWLLKVASCSGSIMVTGSHISANLNGLKFFAFREEILKEHEEEITRIYDSLKETSKIFADVIDVNKENRAIEEYEEMLVSIGTNKMPKLGKIIVDPGNGSQSDIMPRVLKRLGLNILEVNASIQQDFVSRDTEVEGVLKSLQKQVVEEKADLGIAYDYDGDRVVFVDKKGNFIPGDYSGSLVAKYSLSEKIVTPINTSSVVDFIGKKIIRTKVGSPFVVKAMKENGSDFGFEANGGGISSEVMMSRDGGSTTIKVLKIISRLNKTLSQLIEEMPKFFQYREKVDCPNKFNGQILELAEKEFQGIKIEKIDGLKIWQDDSSWILFRPSSNAPEFRVFSEAKTKDQADNLGKRGIEFVKTSIKNSI